MLGYGSTRRRWPAQRLALAVALTLAAAPALAVAAPGDLTTIAGGPGGGLAVGAGLVPSGLAIDGGRLIVTDQQNGAIRAIALATGDITALAGTGSAGSSSAYSTTGRPGTLTQLPGLAASVAGPLAVTVAADGDVIFSVGGGGTIRRLDSTTGTLTRIAGNGTFSSTGPGDGGPATEAGLSLVLGIAIDRGGAVLLADGSSGRIRSIDPESGVITTVAGGRRCRRRRRPSRGGTPHRPALDRRRSRERRPPGGRIGRTSRAPDQRGR